MVSTAKKIYLSPAQHAKPCLVPGCSEAAHANAIADAMERILTRAGFLVLRNDPETQVPLNHVRRANAWGADLYLAIHTNAGGGKRCTVYNSGSDESAALSYALASAFGEVYPHPVRPNADFPAEKCEENWTELTASQMSAAYCELWFHDNPEDSEWGHAHIGEAAYALCCGICDYWNLPRPLRRELNFDGLTVEEIARVTAAEARGEPYEGMLAVTQCMLDRWKDPARRFGKNLPQVLEGFAAPYAGDLSQTHCEEAVREVFLFDKRVFEEPCLWCLGKTAKEETFLDRNRRFRFLGQIGDQYFWGDEKPAVPHNSPILQKGDRGDAVKELQCRLIELGYALPRYGADGIFGTETQTAVRLFQRVAGCAVDGIVGPETRKALGDGKKPVCYAVRAGDTLTSIARRFGTSASTLARINAISDPDLIRVGQELRIA